MDSDEAFGLEALAEFDASVTLPDGKTTVQIKLSGRSTVDQVKATCFKKIPQLAGYSRLRCSVGVDADNLVAVEFARFVKCHPSIQKSYEAKTVVSFGIFERNTVESPTVTRHRDRSRSEANSPAWRAERAALQAAKNDPAASPSPSAGPVSKVLDYDSPRSSPLNPKADWLRKRSNSSSSENGAPISSPSGAREGGLRSSGSFKHFDGRPSTFSPLNVPAGLVSPKSSPSARYLKGGNGEKPAWVSRVESSRPSAINTQSSRAAGDTRDSSVESSLDATPLTADSSDAFVASSGSTDTLVAPSPTAAPATVKESVSTSSTKAAVLTSETKRERSRESADKPESAAGEASESRRHGKRGSDGTKRSQKSSAAAAAKQAEAQSEQTQDAEGSAPFPDLLKSRSSSFPEIDVLPTASVSSPVLKSPRRVSDAEFQSRLAGDPARPDEVDDVDEDDDDDTDSLGASTPNLSRPSIKSRVKNKVKRSQSQFAAYLKGKKGAATRSDVDLTSSRDDEIVSPSLNAIMADNYMRARSASESELSDMHGDQISPMMEAKMARRQLKGSKTALSVSGPPLLDNGEEVTATTVPWLLGTRPLAHDRVAPGAREPTEEEAAYCTPAVLSWPGWIVERAAAQSKEDYENASVKPSEANGNSWFRDHFTNYEGTRYFVGEPVELGPTIIAVHADKQRGYRAIVRSRAGEDFVAFPLSAVKVSSVLRSKPSTKEILRTLDARLGDYESDFCEVERDREHVAKQFASAEERQHVLSYKFGALYVRDGQTVEEDMFGNVDGSAGFNAFMESLGERVQLEGWQKYRAGLDVSGRNTTGTHSIYTKLNDFEIMFHVSTMLPHRSFDVQQLERKRHIGNDICMIVYRENCTTPWRPNTVESEFIHIIMVVDAKVKDPETPSDDDMFAITIVTKQAVPQFGPALPEGHVFKRGEMMRNAVLCKLVNGENTAFSAPIFATKIKRTRYALYKLLADPYLPKPGK